MQPHSAGGLVPVLRPPEVRIRRTRTWVEGRRVWALPMAQDKCLPSCRGLKAWGYGGKKRRDGEVGLRAACGRLTQVGAFIRAAAGIMTRAGAKTCAPRGAFHADQPIPSGRRRLHPPRPRTDCCPSRWLRVACDPCDQKRKPCDTSHDGAALGWPWHTLAVVGRCTAALSNGVQRRLDGTLRREALFPPSESPQWLVDCSSPPPSPM